MASIETLPADQRAVLELVLRRGRSYDDIAQLLSIDRAGVRQRALAAFDALGPKTRVAPDRRALITDYLLEALPSGVATEVREHLGASASERAWARAVASELEGLTERPLPEIPSNGRGSRAEVPAAAALSNGSPRERPLPHASRRGGAIVLALAAAVALALVLVFVVFTGGSKHRPRARASTPATPTTSTPSTGSTTPGTTTPNGISILSQVNLGSPTGAANPFGIAYVVKVKNRDGVLIRAQGLPANSQHPPNRYAVWLYNSSKDSYFLGAVKTPVKSNGQLVTGGGLPTNAGRYHRVLVTLETQARPKTPGHIVLQGTLKGL
jgi:hypothetical protein